MDEIRHRRRDRAGERTALAEIDAAGLATFPMLCATGVPIGRDGDGLPIGVQAIADRYADHTAIAVARLANEVMQ